MSTDQQQFSIANQKHAIQAFATRRNLAIVKTYADEGKSGLNFEGRKGLQLLISDICANQATFAFILVYDLSRWGRFQDVDESAHYEFICKQAGVHVIYCAEQFDNDGSFLSTMAKSLKRTMAAEYSRELSSTVFNCRSEKYRHGPLRRFGMRS